MIDQGRLTEADLVRLRDRLAELDAEANRLRSTLQAADVRDHQAITGFDAAAVPHAAAMRQRQGGPSRAELHAATAQRQHAEMLQSADGLRLILDSAIDYAIFTTDLNGIVTSWNTGARRLLGYEADEIIGRDGRIIFTPEQRERGEPETEMQTAFGQGRAEDERWHLRKNGSCFWASGLLMPLRNDAGELQGFLKILRDRTEQRRIEDALRESEERLRLILESAVDYAIFTTDRDGRITSWNSGAQRMLGYEEPEILGQDVRMLFTPEAREDGELATEMKVALAEGRAEREGWHLRKDGSRLWTAQTLMPLRGWDGAMLGFLKVMHDRTERKRAEEHQKLLLAELSHRVKNTLATVRAIAGNTLRSTPSPEAFRAAFSDRLTALSTAHSLLSRGNWEGAALRDIVVAELSPHLGARSDRICLAGADVRLEPRAALSLGMAVHELATNAAKHGALSTSSGRIKISWGIGASGGGGTLHLLWVETGGPPVKTPQRRGFGSTLIERGLAYELGGAARLDFAPSGVRCRIEVPLRSAP